MDPLMLVQIVFRWLHIVPAIALVGGAFFMRFAWWPAVSRYAGKDAAELRETVRRRWSRVVMFSILLLLLSGLVNTGMIEAMNQWPGDVTSGMWRGLLVVKIVLALIVFFLSSLISGRSKLAKKLERNMMMWLSLNLAAAVLVVTLAGVMRFLPREPKGTEPVSLRASAEHVQRSH